MERVIDSEPEVKLLQDLDMAKRFLNALGPDRPIFTFQTFDDQKRGRVYPRILHGSLDEHWKTLVEQNALGAGIYVMIQPGDGEGREESNVIGVDHLFLDLDGSPIRPVLEAHIKPHLVMFTSKKDGKKRFQCLYKIHRIEVNDQNRPQIKANLTRLQMALATKFAGDMKVTKDLCRVCRLPGCFHQKRDPSMVNLVKIFEHEPHSCEAIEEWLEAADQTSDGTSPSGPPSVTIKVTEGQRNDHLFRYASGKAAQGLSFDEILVLTQVKNLDECDPPLTEKEVGDIAKSAAKYAAEHGLSGKEFIPKLFTRAIREKWDVINYLGQHYRYVAGVFTFWNDMDIKRLVLKWSNENASVTQLELLVKRLQIETYFDQEDVNPLGLLNIQNGILDPETGIITPHTSAIRFTIQLSITCEHPPTSDDSPPPNCPRFQAYLEAVLRDPKQRDLAWEILGICCTTDTSFELAFILFGSGQNGKTVFLNVVRALFRGYVSEIRLAKLSDRFSGAGLLNKLVNVSGEGEAAEMVDDALIKGLITGEPLTIERKYENPIDIKPFAKFIVATNNLPRTRDKSDGWMRRWIILDFNVKITEDQKDVKLSEKIISEELDQIFYGALLGLRRLRKQGHFTIPESSKMRAKEYEETINPVVSFIDDHLTVVPEGRETLSDIYSKYRDWCESQGHKHVMTQASLRKEIERRLSVPISKLAKGARGFKGLVLTEKKTLEEIQERLKGTRWWPKDS